MSTKPALQGFGSVPGGSAVCNWEVDTVRYSKMADCKTLVCMIYDPEDRIPNPGGLQADLSGEKEGIKIEVLVVPKRYE